MPFMARLVLLGLAVGSVKSFASVGWTRQPMTRVRLFSSRHSRIGGLLDWAQQSDIQISKFLQLSSSEGSGLGWFAKDDLPRGSLLLTVPTAMALTVEVPGDGPDDAAVKSLTPSNLDNFPWYIQMGVYLYKLDKVSSSNGDVNYRPWLDSLPRSFDTPVHWDDLEQLQYPTLMEAVNLQSSRWKSYHRDLNIPAMTYEAFVWGCECARSRAFSGSYTGSGFDPNLYAFTLLLVTIYVGLGWGSLEQAANGAGLVVAASILRDFVLPKLQKKKRYVICPMIDMANHQSTGFAGEVSFEFFGNAYSLAVNSPVKNGDQLFISYGDRSNDQLLQYFGFVEVDNPHDVFIMPPIRNWDIEALEGACGRIFQSGRLQKLDRAGLLGTAVMDEEAGNPTGGVVISRKDGIDPAVMQALRALVSTAEEWAQAGEAIGNFSEKLNDKNEAVANKVVKAAMQAELESKPTTLEQDIELLKNLGKMKSSSAETKLAIRFRIEKKKLLRDTINRFA